FTWYDDLIISRNRIPDPDGTTAPPTGDTTAPGVPGGLTATAVSASQINLAWSTATDNVGVAGYRVFRNGTQIGTPNGTSFPDSGLAPSTASSYTVAAVDAAGNLSARSGAASATTKANTPTTPTTATLSVTRAGTGSGTVTSAPAGVSCGATCSHAF